ncbi:MAG: PspC domain-containing protein [Candidatus Leucobacter sulfamidivorax]|nr:PspC domain-containing protein [Candidatus Leucobacter sulfamidivorax]
MDDTTPPPGEPQGTAGATGSAGSAGPAPRGGSNQFFLWLRSIGIVRSGDRWFAGVAGGIAAKAGIDPLIVRGVFVVLAVLGGPGLLLYLAGWLLLPDASGRIHLEDIVRGRASTGVIVTAVILGVIFVVPLIMLVFSIAVPVANGWGWNSWPIFGYPEWLGTIFSIIWWAVLLPAAIVWLVIWLVRRSSTTAASGGTAGADGAGATNAGSAEGGGSTETGRGFADTDGGSPGAFAGSPGAADGSAAFAAASSESFGERMNRQANEWGRRANEKASEWGEQANEWGKKVGDETAAWSRQYEATRLGAAQTVLTLAIALLAAGAAAVWALTSGALLGSPVPGDGAGALFAAIVAAVAVLALSLIVAGARGRRTGWVGFLSFCGVVVLIFTAVIPWGSRVHLFGSAEIAVTEHSPPGLVMIAGNATVDLSRIEEGQSFSLWMVGGNATIDLPEEQPVIVNVGLIGGNIADTDADGERRYRAGPFPHQVIGANLRGADADEVSRIRVYLVGGNVSVNGSNASPELVDRFANASAPASTSSNPTPSAAIGRTTLEYAS